MTHPTTNTNGPYTFETVWAALMEDREQNREQRKQFQEQRKLNEEQYDKVARMMEENAREMKETYRRIGELGNRFGELAEHLVRPRIGEKFNELGFHFSLSSEHYKVKIPGNPGIFAEVDIMLENGDVAIAIEVKAKPSDDDVKDHLERMDTLRKVANLKNIRRTYRGALAGAIMSESVRNFAIKSGLYVIEPSGDTVRINIPEGFKPREW